MIKPSGVIILRSTLIENDSRTLKTANSLVKHGYDVCILGWDREGSGNSNPQIQLKDGIANICLFKTKAGYAQGIKTLFKLLKFQSWLFLQLLKRRKKYQVIHSCDFDTSLPAILTAKIFRKKLVYDIYDYYTHSHYVPGNLKALVEKMDNFVINHATSTIICHEDRYKQIMKARPRNVTVIHNTPEIPSDINQQLTVVKSQSPNLKLVYIGLLQDHRLLQEIAQVIKGSEKFELHIGGFGDLSDYFRELSEEYENIYFYGKVDYKDVLKLESECDILFAVYNPAIENHRYSAPNKLYEAMALGKPIIVGKGTGIDGLISRNKVGLAIEYTSEAFWEAVNILRNNPDLRKEMGEQGREIYKSKYSWSIMEDKLIDLYA
ncbi:hypothetical protein DP73_04775 [Desulfosporosinus sp. HMP52]|uniref:glycosyltransferase family 4 protein n=1 Tax=Desulfosporosinus sp. HMP52 TaxID=1487923 RepID=UPI00051FB390|nr:glycosyltransferase family 4 protein [Desulfosporosinus sp. HMP52]KGK91277.1 hypothetical protein DP73_04775 [Desulfosporosinus sp. HMP52]